MFSVVFPIILTLVGIFMLIKLRFFFILHPIKTAKEFLDEMRDKNVRRSFFLALAGTLGVGNIFGVAAGIMIGGAGSLFWLFISSFFSMIIKYSETLLVFDMADEGEGMWAVLKKAFPKCGIVMSGIYVVSTAGLSLFMGSAMQASAVTDVAKQTLKSNWFVLPIFLIIFLAPCLIGDVRKVDKITEIIIPLTTIIYIFMCFGIIFLHFAKIPVIIFDILSSAFSFKSIAGGVTVIAIKEGFARGILSNEAGVGTSALAHSSARGRTPHVAGLFGMCEVFFDTSLLCMLTGFSILLVIDDFSAYKTPMSLVRAAFVNSWGSASEYFLLLSIFLFAYATLICWYFYGNRSISVISLRLKTIYSFIFIFFVGVSGWFSYTFLLSVTDAFLFLMALMTLSVIIKKRHRIFLSSKNEEES